MGLINKFLFKNHKATQFVSIGISPGEISEKAVLSFHDKQIDVSSNHWILCQVPFVVGIFLNNLKGPDKCTLLISIRNVECTSISLVKTKYFDFASGSLVLYNVTGVSCFQLNMLHRFLLLTYFYFKRKNKFGFREARQFCALYSFPRKVSIISFKDHKGYNLFPMDFQGYIPEEGIHILGLRHSNITLSRIIENKSVVVSEVNASNIRDVYYLGEHHSSQPPLIGELPFSIIESRFYKFYLPDFITSYKEIKIINTFNLGSHMLLIGEVVSEQSLKKEKNHLFHLHFIQYLERQKIEM